MARLAVMIVVVVVGASCKQIDLDYCLVHPGIEGCSDAGSAGGPCKSSADCTDTANFPACKTMAGPHVNTCVQCTATEHVLCTGTTPICKDDNCAACTIDSDCGTGGLCLPNGACADPSSIIHAVSSGGSTMATCGGTGVGNACTLDAALATVDSMRNVIKLDDGGPYVANGSNANYTVNANVTIDARNATLHRNMDGPILTIGNGKIVTIFGGKIEGAINGEGIQCTSNATLTVDGTTIDMNEKAAINTASGCKLTVTKATINNNSLKSGQFISAIQANGDSVTLSQSQFTMDKGGGITVSSGTFSIIGNVFLNNGDPNSPNGGVLINTGPDPANRLEFNSISGNHAVGNDPVVSCTAGIGSVARNNIIWGNNDSTGLPVGGTCKHAYSDIEMLIVGSPNDGGNNLNVDPMFTADLHLMPTSTMLIKAADPMAKLAGIAAKDIDGDLRVAPADIGADQLPRQ